MSVEQISESSVQSVSNGESILAVSGLSKRFRSGASELTVLENIHFAVNRGESVSIVGPSGSGKTTLLGLCAGLDAPTTGSVRLCGSELTHLGEDARAEIRNRHVGFVFQNFQLIPTLTALENVMVPSELRGERRVASRARALLEDVGLGERLEHYPVQLSGGEQQRVGLARAFMNQPEILFADEPTGNLDDATSGHITELLFDINRAAGTTLVLVTHDLELASRTQRLLRMHNGHLTEQDER